MTIDHQQVGIWKLELQTYPIKGEIMSWKEQAQFEDRKMESKMFLGCYDNCWKSHDINPDKLQSNFLYS
jgi:hypothetical protein